MSAEPTPFNPYKPPDSRVADSVALGGDVEADRQKHLKTEASIRSLGMLYLLGAWISVLGVAFLLLTLVVSWFDTPAEDRAALLVGMGLILGVYALLTWLNFWVGHGLRAFRRGPRMFVLVTSWIGLIGFPVGTLMAIFFLILLLGEKGKRVFEPDYPAVIEATPHIRYRTPVWIWLLLFGVLAFIALMVALAVIGAGV